MIGNQTGQRIFGLDLMRALAILMVLFGHCVWIFPESQGLFHQMMVLSGFLGVEVFFVLSGFLIGKLLYELYLKEDFSVAKVFYFLKRRWFRTLPNYFLILLVDIGIAGLVGYTTPSLWKYFFFLQNFNTTMLSFFPESWSLSVEEYAYIVLPFFLFAVGTVVRPKDKSRFFLGSVLALILIFFCAKIYYQITTTNVNVTQWNVSLKAVVVYRLDSIFIGVLCSWVYCNFKSFWQNNKLIFFVLGLCIFVFQFIAIGYFRLLIETHPLLWNVFYLPLVSLAVACFLPFLSDWETEMSFLKQPVVFISIVSYSVYLLHYSVVLQLLKHYIHYDPAQPLQLYGFVLAYVSITFFLSYLLYRFYEKPMMDLRDKNW
ncbi:acyltransferase family protein [Flavobacterium sp. XGLA_31]|uniref:acyltransferase family protein n=1 Tax=Flavobacterium sp. XGLA_31 TaxID=3447666 RepID=UPI003F34891E